jgi:hypothetical protein
MLVYRYWYLPYPSNQEQGASPVRAYLVPRDRDLRHTTTDNVLARCLSASGWYGTPPRMHAALSSSLQLFSIYFQTSKSQSEPTATNKYNKIPH